MAAIHPLDIADRLPPIDYKLPIIRYYVSDQRLIVSVFGFHINKQNLTHLMCVGLPIFPTP